MPLLQRYAQAVQADAHATDEAQHAIVVRLDALERCLLSQPVPGVLRRWFISLRREHHYPGSCRGVYLWGAVGRGKTWLMDQFHDGLPPHSARRLHFAHFMREIHTRRRRIGGKERPLDHIAALLARAAQVYCLDEFVVQDIGDAMILHGVLDGLLRRGVVLVITSNTPPLRLYEGGLQRERFLPAIALLTRHLDVLQIGTGVDYRQRQLQSAPTYLDCSAADTPRLIHELFARLAGTAAIDESTTLAIEDRRIETVRHAGGMAWFTFAALCEGPRSADDYIAIARRLHTVFLTDVPRFDGGSDDAARRFIALIDELYDQNVRLVISAAAEPFDLYHGERLREAFGRTSSRLTEMRSSEYLSSERQSADEARIDQ